jgi:hypothetical protein
MNYRMATDEDLMQLAELRRDFRMEGGDELPAVSKPEFVEVCGSFLERGLESGRHVYRLADEDGA